MSIKTGNKVIIRLFISGLKNLSSDNFLPAYSPEGISCPEQTPRGPGHLHFSLGSPNQVDQTSRFPSAVSQKSYRIIMIVQL